MYSHEIGNDLSSVSHYHSVDSLYLVAILAQ